jgi:RNA polymerase sigma-70 factor (ECF subfamily)
MPSVTSHSDRRLEQLLERYSSLLRALILRHCPRDLGIQVGDIEQEARVRLWHALQREKELSDPPSYIYRIAVTATIDAVRRVIARREDQLPVHPGEEEKFIDTPSLVASPAQSPEAVAERRQLMAAIAGAVNSLAENRQIAVRLYLQGLTLPEIAELVGWSEPKIRNLVYRGLEDLRQILRREGIDYQ